MMINDTCRMWREENPELNARGGLCNEVDEAQSIIIESEAYHLIYDVLLHHTNTTEPQRLLCPTRPDFCVTFVVAAGVAFRSRRNWSVS